MVVTINQKPKATMVSILGTRWLISGTNDTEKINAAYTVGGSQSSMKTVENLKRSNQLLRFDQHGRSGKVVNAIGGIDASRYRSHAIHTRICRLKRVMPI